MEPKSIIYIFNFLPRVHRHIKTNMINRKCDFASMQQLCAVNQSPVFVSLSSLPLSLCHTLMSEPLDVDSRLIQALNEWCFINGPIIRLPAGGQSPSIFSARWSNNEGRITHLEERRRLSGSNSMLISYNSYACTYSRLDAGDKQVMHVWNNYEQECCCYWMINRWTSKAVGLLSIHPTLGHPSGSEGRASVLYSWKVTGSIPLVRTSKCPWAR